jgi:hypothetical protein
MDGGISLSTRLEGNKGVKSKWEKMEANGAGRTLGRPA